MSDEAHEGNGMIPAGNGTADNAVTLMVESAARQLAEARGIENVLRIRDQAEAIRHHARIRGCSLQAQNDAAEIKLWSERRLGELLAETVRPGNPQLLHDETIGRLPEGITRTDSSRWQGIARLDEELFKQHIAETREQEKEVTTAGVLRLVRELNKPGNQGRPPLGDGCTVDDLGRLVEKIQNGEQEPFGCVYADPPWQYGNQATRASTDNHYVTMAVEQIAALPIGDLMAQAGHLHLWTTKGFLREALDIIEVWGFEYKGWFVWTKPQMGLGNYWRSSTELLLLGVKGDLVFADKGLMDWGSFKRGGHSNKPAEIRGYVERASPGPYLELFGRRSVKGWSVWGNEIRGEEFRQETFA